MFIKHLWNQVCTLATIDMKGIRSVNLTIKDLQIKYDGPIPLNSKKLSNIRPLLKYIPPIYLCTL